MRDLKDNLKYRKINYEKLEEYGFKKDNSSFSYQENILDNKFCVNITIDNDKIKSKLIENAIGEEYILVDIKNATGEYVGKVNEAYEKVINDFVNNCSVSEVYKSIITYQVIDYIKSKYNEIPEYLWKDDNQTGVFRHKEDNKWYGIIMVIPKNRLGYDSNEEVEVINIKNNEVDNIIGKNNIFPAYHMNKKYWVSILLDENVNINYIYELIDKSYNLTKKKKKS
ncbi:MAG: MmcQ/YjbR family DNA-binding protein [Bacilli bacterium]|nr:MmcQ/YjbR family DNA-binding protein [Bacilli bacterium]